MTYAIINKPVAQLKKEASFCSLVEDEAVYGMKVLILYKCGEWYFVRTHYRYEGFIHVSYLLFSVDRIDTWDRCCKKLILINHADVLKEPKYQSNIIISLTKSAQVAVLSDEIENGFVSIKLLDGTIGYIRNDFLSSTNDAGYEDEYYNINIDKGINALSYINIYLKKSEEEFRSGLIAEALTYLGSQYRWGGRTPLGIDCSGLCFTAYLMNGLIIFRDSVIKEGFPIHEISFKDIKLGDLLYFRGHIAMYIGGYKYIHSTGSFNGVIINSLNPLDSDYRQDLHETLYAAGSVF